MAAADPFDISVIDILNALLREKCPYLSLFYKSEPGEGGKYKRRIGFYYNKTGGKVVFEDLEISYIKLDENLENELKIDSSFTRDEAEYKIKFKERKLNLCLRLLAGMIASTEGAGLRSVAVSPITLYTMVKYFDCTIEKQYGKDDKNPKCSTLAGCKTFMEQAEVAPGETDDYNGEAVNVSILTSVPDYHAMLQTLMRVINDLNCVGLGGTRRKRKKNKVSRQNFTHTDKIDLGLDSNFSNGICSRHRNI